MSDTRGRVSDRTRGTITSSDSSYNTLVASETSSNPGGKNYVIHKPYGLPNLPTTTTSSQAVASIKGGSQPGCPKTSTPSLDPSLNHACKVSKLHSRTAIGRLSYHLKELPKLLIVDLRLKENFKDANGLEPVRNRELLSLTVHKWFEKSNLTNVRPFASIKLNTGISGARIEARVIIRFDGEQYKENTRVRILDRPATSELDVERPTKGGDNVKHVVHCEIVGVKDEKDEGAYQESLAHILREVSHGPDFFQHYSHDQKAVDALLPNLLDDDVSNATKEPKLRSWFDLYVKMQPSFDVRERTLNVNYSLVPGIENISAVDLLQKLLGTKHPTSDDIEKELTALCHTLCGMRAHLIYKPLPKIEATRANIEILQKRDIGRKIQIQDIKAHDDPTFEMGRGVNKITVSAAAYFSKATKTSKPLDKNLPFVRDSTGAWIPFELLEFKEKQPLSSFRHRNQAIQRQIKIFLKVGGVARLRELADKLIANSSAGVVTKDIDTHGRNRKSPGWLQAATPGLFSSRSSFKPCLESIDVKLEQTPIGFLKIDEPDSACTHAFGTLFERRYGKLKEYDPSFTPNEVFKSSSQMLEDEIKLLVAVINDIDSPPKETVKWTIARLHRASETDLGVPLLCIPLSHVKTRILTAAMLNEHVPSDLFAKIDLMLGRTSPGQAPLKSPLVDNTTIIVGAHVRGKNDENKTRPPIAAVVASKDASAVQYAGSVRQQATNENEIKQLSDMMKEVLGQFKSDTPTRMIFFRDSIEFDNAAITEEIKHIYKGYDAYFSDGKLELTYVVVNKNTALKYDRVASPDADKIVPKFDYLAVGDKHAKHRYYVMHNDTKMEAAELADLTGRLNSSFPLNLHGQTSKALPLLHAAKLTRRVNDYLLCDNNARKIVPAAHRNTDGPQDERQLPWKEKLDGTMFYL